MTKEMLEKRYPVGSKVTILSMDGEPHYTGRVGKITHIDDAGQIHGTWGGLAILPDKDSFVIEK